MSKIYKAELVAAVSARLALPKMSVAAVFDELFIEMAKALAAGATVNVKNFGTFTPSKTRGKDIYRPYDGFLLKNVTEVRINFRPSKDLKRRVGLPPADLLLATHNKDKVAEIKAGLARLQALSLAELGDFTVVEETGTSFRENAFLKAKYYYDKYHLPVLADDSGLVVQALGGAPGIYSARYAGPEADSKANIARLLTELTGVRDRAAEFVCVLCYYDGQPHYFEGKVAGTIAEEVKNPEGFGYDPVFIYQSGVRFNELALRLKNKISHRGQALAAWLDYMEGK